MRALLLSIGLAAHVFSADAQDIDLGTDTQRGSGRLLYEIKCAQCHGVKGDGVSPGSPYLRPGPRDFTSGIYKFRTTENGEIPSDEDIKRSIRNGMPYTSMPAWPSLSDDDVTNLMYYLKTFSEDFIYFGDAVSFEIPDPPEITAESLARGRDVYVENQCTDCHGNHGRSNGISSPTLKDMWNSPIRATDMTMRWTYRGGTSRKDIYRTFTAGIDGTPMPAYKIEPLEDRWHLVNYVASLSEVESDYGTVVRAVRVPDTPGDALSPAMFRSAPPTMFPVVAQLIEPGRSFFPAATAIEVRAVVTGEHVAVMLQWNDMSAQVTGWNDPKIDVPLWLEDSDTTEVFSDAVAVQFPSSTESGLQKPYFLFGDIKRPTDIWFADLSETEPWHYIGRGTGLLQIGSTPLDMWSRWDDGQWTVIFRRARIEMDHAAFEEGRFVPIAFSVWDGFSRERGNRRGVTSWYNLYVQRADDGSPIPSMLILGLLTLMAGVVAAIRLQWKFLGDDSRGNVLRENEYLLRKCPISRPLKRIIRREGLTIGIKDYRKLRETQPDTYNFSPDELIKISDSYLRAGNVDAALAFLHLNLETHPHDVPALDHVGHAYMQAGKPDQATAFYEKSAALNPERSMGRLILEARRRGDRNSKRIVISPIHYRAV